jgi:tetratricopeptide (TPR) repeat protein
MSQAFRQITFGLSAVAIALLLAVGPVAAAGTRLALVLGNSKYQNAPQLANPANDAQDLAKALRQIGFDVIEQHDASRDAMVKAVHDFAGKLPSAQVALFFYAGHGLQMNGENYLVPVDAKVETASDVRFNTISLADIQAGMEGSGGTGIIILDACRDNPFADKLAQGTRGIRLPHGLVRTETMAPGSLVVYSTQPNNVAQDGTGRNSPFTEALLKYVTTPGLEVRQMISRVRGDVLAATANQQTPWDSSSLVGDVYLASDPADVALQPAAAIKAPPVSPLVPPQPPAPDVVAATETECERLAGHHVRRTMVSSANAEGATDWTHAAALCQAEVAAHPGDPRFVYALGRAQDRLKNYSAALHNFQTAVDAGDVDALVDLGLLYSAGHGVLQSYPIAFADLSKAAAAGSSLGMANLASMYGNGFGVAKDPVKALDLAEKAIEAGNPFGLRIVANHYFNGSGVPRDYQMAAQYLQQSVDLGDGQAMKFLANMYESGYLGAPNPAKASELRLQAQRIDPDSPPPSPDHLPLLHQTVASAPAPHRRRYVVYRPMYEGQPALGGNPSYNPAWQAAPGDTSCCPNNMLICPMPRHFCGH